MKYQKYICGHCNGDGEVEVCTSCANEVENCECDDEEIAPSESEECPECNGSGEIDDEE